MLSAAERGRTGSSFAINIGGRKKEKKWAYMLGQREQEFWRRSEYL
jgi:hypothetical protein